MGADATGAAMRPGLLPAARAQATSLVRRRRFVAALSCSLALFASVIVARIAWPDSLAREAGIPTRAIDNLDLVASVIAYELQLVAGREVPNADHLATLKRRLPSNALANQRTAYVTDAHGTVVASTAARSPRSISDLFQDDDGTSTDQTERVGQVRLRDGTPALLAVRPMGSGHITLAQPLDAARRDEHGNVLHDALPIAVLLAFAGLGIGGLGYRRSLRLRRLNRSRSSRIDASLSHGRCGVWDWDTTRHRVFWSASMYELLGYQPRGEHLSAGEVIALLHPEDSDVRGLLAALSADDAGDLDREIRVRTASGDWIWLRIKGETVREPANGSRHMVGLAIDVTEQRLAAERRARDDQRLREAVDSLPDAFVLWDAEDRLIVCNSKYLALNGIPADHAAPGTPSREIMAASKPPVVSRPIEPATPEAVGTRKLETQIEDGRWFHISERRTRDGGTVSVGTDVSDIKRQEAKLQARARHLQGSVRAAETAAQCYALAAERNFEASQAKTEFMARVSHELLTPLNAIIGFSDLMCTQMFGPLDARYAGYSADIHTSGIKLLGIINGMLHMSRSEKGQLEFSPGPLIVADMLQGVLKSLQRDIDARGVSVELDVGHPLVVEADEAAFRETLLQIVRNAVKFSLCGGRVRIRARSALGRINIFVEDAGVGIPAERLSELGQPFAQVEAEYHRSCGGAGLGLAIAQSLLDLHGGTLTLRSQENLGTIALVSLPKVQPAANDSDKPAPLPAASRVLVAAG